MQQNHESWVITPCVNLHHHPLQVAKMTSRGELQWGKGWRFLIFAVPAMYESCGCLNNRGVEPAWILQIQLPFENLAISDTFPLLLQEKSKKKPKKSQLLPSLKLT